MKKLLIILLLVFVACEIEYDGETKLIVKGIILDENNNPISNQNIKLFVTRESSSIPFVFYLPSESNFIGRAKTNLLGEFIMAIPKPTNNYSEILLLINDDANQYNKKQLRNIQIDDFENSELNILSRKIYNTSNLVHLEVTINQTDFSKELIKIEYIGNLANEVEYLNPLEGSNLYYELNKKVSKNQSLVIRYTLKNYNTNENEVVEDTILIDSSPLVNYTLNF